MKHRYVPIIITAICALTLILLSGCSSAPAQGKLQIVYSGNIRGNVSPCGCAVSKGGVARLASFTDRHHDPDANWLTVDAGNYVDRGGAKGGCTDKCRFMINSYGDLHYDALNLGRSEVQMGYETLLSLRDSVKEKRFVSANLMDIGSGKPMFEPYVIKDYGNMRIGIIGLLRQEDFPASVSLLDTTKLRVDPQLDAAARYIPELISKSDAVVLLCDLPQEDVDKIVTAFPDLDLIISTGAMKLSEEMTLIGTTRVVGSGSQGYNGHMATLEFNPAWGDSIGFTALKVELTSAYDQPGEWAARLAEFEKSTGTEKNNAQNTAKKPS